MRALASDPPAPSADELRMMADLGLVHIGLPKLLPEVPEAPSPGDGLPPALRRAFAGSAQLAAPAACLATVFLASPLLWWAAELTSEVFGYGSFLPPLATVLLGFGVIPLLSALPLATWAWRRGRRLARRDPDAARAAGAGAGLATLLGASAGVVTVASGQGATLAAVPWLPSVVGAAGLVGWAAFRGAAAGRPSRSREPLEVPAVYSGMLSLTAGAVTSFSVAVTAVVLLDSSGPLHDLMRWLVHVLPSWAQEAPPILLVTALSLPLAPLVIRTARRLAPGLSRQGFLAGICAVPGSALVVVALAFLSGLAPAHASVLMMLPLLVVTCELTRRVVNRCWESAGTERPERLTA